MIIPERHEIIWSQTLFACMQEMAERKTNPTMLILDGVENIENERRYPDESLYFAEGQWRAFYHCHEAPNASAQEHGHFHLFTREADNWAHVAGLSIDHFGQPVHWFSVNRWVTGGVWLSRDALLHHFHTDHYNIDDSLVGRWLFSMLQVFRSVLLELYQQRDHAIKQLTHQGDTETVFEERDIYTLASIPVDIQTTLEICLSAIHESRHNIRLNSADLDSA